MQITKDVYILPQSGMLAHYQLLKIIKHAAFRPEKHTPGLWVHNTRPHLNFFHVVGDFGIKYTRQEDANFPRKTLTNAKYKIADKWLISFFLWHHYKMILIQPGIFISVHGYVAYVLQRFHNSKINHLLTSH